MLEVIKQYKNKLSSISEEKKKLFLTIGIIACSVLLAAGVAYLVYRLISKKREEELTEYDEDLEDDFFEDDDA